MYHAYFHIKESPFALTPDPRFLFMSQQHREALAHLLYGITEGGGFVLLTGEVGTGKTTLCRSLMEQVPEVVDVALILNPRQTAVELVASICDELRIDYPEGTESLKVLTDCLNRFLLENHAKGRRTTLVIDEAQNLSPETLEQIRLLTNLETTTEKLLQIILIGQPELRTILVRPEMRQLAQRITARFHLSSLSRQDTLAYVRHRLDVVGLKGQVFIPGTLRIIHKLSGGVPRVINILCDRALLGAYAKQQEHVSKHLLRKAYSEISGKSKRPGSRRIVGWAAVSLLLIWVVLGWRFIPWQFPPHRPLLERATAKVQAIFVPAPPPAPEDITGRTEGKTPVRPTGIQPVSIPAGMGGPTLEAEKSPGKKSEVTSANRLSGLFLEGNLRTDEETAFNALFRAWNLSYEANGETTPCKKAEEEGLHCIRGRGSWMTLRHYNRPVLLELIGETGKFRYVTITAIGDLDVTLDFVDQKRTLPRTDIDPYWLGDFIILWKPPRLIRRLLKKGISGPDVIWLREQLERLVRPVEKDLVPAGPLFDTGLKRRVMAFQRMHGLEQDGIVGQQTLIQLNTALQVPGIPLLFMQKPLNLR